jgi:hypothetical protein
MPTNYDKLVRQLRGEAAALSRRLGQVTLAIRALTGIEGDVPRRGRRSLGAERTPTGTRGRRRRRRMSAEARAKISAAQKKRWAERRRKGQ